MQLVRQFPVNCEQLSAHRARYSRDLEMLVIYTRFLNSCSIKVYSPPLHLSEFLDFNSILCFLLTSVLCCIVLFCLVIQQQQQRQMQRNIKARPSSPLKSNFIPILLAHAKMSVSFIWRRQVVNGLQTGETRQYKDRDRDNNQRRVLGITEKQTRRGSCLPS